ncbi:MAG: DUF2098 family protein [Methanomassiliicoccales archaeon]
MKVGDFARYRNTGTVGKVMDTTVEGGVTWVLLDTYDLCYDASALEPANPEQYHRVAVKEKTLEESLEEVERLKESLEEAEKTIGRITPSGT